jgi:uncharacterized protein (TIGR03083 family)
MTNHDIAAALADERTALADLFDSLTADQLATWSLCAKWTVKDVAGHLTTLFNTSMVSMTVRIARNRFSFAKAVEQFTQELSARPIEEITAQLRANASNRKHPPTAPVAPLADVIVHAQDVRVPLGLPRDVPFERVSAAMTFVTGGRAVGFVPPNRLRGLRFQATDGDGVWGSGQLIHGPALSLLMGAMGRRVAFADLGGAVDVLSARLDGKVPRIS